MLNFILSAVVLAQGATLQAESVSGSVTYRERMALTPSAELIVAVDRFDGSLQSNLSELSIKLRGRQVPINYSLPFMASRDRAKYGVRAMIKDGGRIMFQSESAKMFTPGSKALHNLTLVRGGGEPWSWKDKSWELMELEGNKLELPSRMPTLKLSGEGNRIEGFGGVNRFGGTYAFSAPHIQIDPGAMTMMAGTPEAMRLESRFVQVLPRVNRLIMEEGELLLQRGEKVLARFRVLKR